MRAQQRAARTTLQQQRSIETRRALMQAGERLWRERAFDDVSVGDVCAEAGVSKGLFYFYFPRKEFLLVILVFARLFPSDESIHRLIDQGLTTHEICHKIALSLARRARRMPKHLVGRAIEAGFTIYKELRAEQGGDKGWTPPLVKVFERGKERGEIAPEWNSDVMAHAMSWSFVYSVLSWANGTEVPGLTLERTLAMQASLVAKGGSQPFGEPQAPSKS
ncbi:MAG: TetR/AcrR family transcriptional regulator [Alphaproteobacteria bacterium]|nr:TetR/AcrR family transcriptional regulator [Alphaproteobacteria bacterium]